MRPFKVLLYNRLLRKLYAFNKDLLHDNNLNAFEDHRNTSDHILNLINKYQSV